MNGDSVRKGRISMLPYSTLFFFFSFFEAFVHFHGGYVRIFEVGFILYFGHFPLMLVSPAVVAIFKHSIITKPEGSIH